MRDVVLITIDCWRFDTLRHMPALREHVDGDDWSGGEAIGQSASTMWAFAQIFASEYHPHVYSIDGEVGPDTISVRPEYDPLPSVLAERGFATAGFVASNPNLDIWQSSFDTWSNQDLEPFPEASSIIYELDYYIHLLLQRTRVDASTLAGLGRRWFQQQDSPRFLWMHAMESHSPYYPGLRKARKSGLLDAYRANRRLSRGSTRDLIESDDADQTIQTLRELYYASVERLDDRLHQMLSFVPDDAIVIILGDHGEEFDHGWLEHTRIYDECVRVPFFAKNMEMPSDSIRQIDLAPTIFDSLGIDSPDSWRGRPATNDRRRSYIIEPALDELNSIYTGVRTADMKLIERRPVEAHDEIAKSEAYDLSIDPQETEDIFGRDERVEALVMDLHEFLHDVDLNKYTQSDQDRSVSDHVQRRLNELGYR